jgi:hypothetical protein
VYGSTEENWGKNALKNIKNSALPGIYAHVLQMVWVHTVCIMRRGHLLKKQNYPERGIITILEERRMLVRFSFTSYFASAYFFLHKASFSVNSDFGLVSDF